MMGEIPLSCHNRGTPTSLSIPGKHQARWLFAREPMDEPSYAKLTHFLSSSELLYTERGVDINCSITYTWVEGTGTAAFPPFEQESLPIPGPIFSSLLLCPAAILFPSHFSFLADEIVLCKQYRNVMRCERTTPDEVIHGLRRQHWRIQK